VLVDPTQRGRADLRGLHERGTRRIATPSVSLVARLTTPAAKNETHVAPRMDAEQTMGVFRFSLNRRGPAKRRAGRLGCFLTLSVVLSVGLTRPPSVGVAAVGIWDCKW